uniref:Uncharacterized protein n=1 Tax=Anopheles farauti TaxID=69004 RepID=A0A182QPP7_9DIPT
MDGEAYQHEREIMETIFEAISDKKETDIARCLNQATVETALKFESVYGISPLVWCLREGDMSHIGLMRVMLTSGLYDCAMVDSKGQTLLAGLVRQCNDKEPFVRSVIMLEIDGVSNADACYRMMKHNSLELFKLFLALRHMNETQLFESLTHAFTKLSVKIFPLSTELRIFVQWKLAHFGYRFLAGECAEPTDDWEEHCNDIRKCWGEIAERYDTNHYEDIDDTLLHLLTVVHNHLYFIQYKLLLEHLPKREVIFCVAIFLYNYKNLSTMYHFMVNKCVVIEFVRMISRQLGLVLHCVEEIKAELVKILKEFQDRDIKMENTFLNESVEKIKSLEINKKDDVVSRFNVKIQNGTANSESLIKEMMRIIRKTDECCVTTKIAEKRTYKEQFKADLMMRIRRNLHRTKHPQNVADRINAELNRRNKSFVCMAEDIVASESFSMDHLLSGKDRRTVRKLKKCYTKMKQFYSMAKIHGHFTQVAQSDPEQSDIFLACLKRALTVFGEAMKNTKSTPNMPNKRVRQTLEQLLTSQLAEFNILHRNTYAKAFSLQRLSIADSLEKKSLINLPNYMTVVRVMLLLLLILVAADIRRSFYGILYRCGTLAALRSLLFYVGKDDSLWTVQRDSFREVQKYFTNARELLMELTQTRVGKTPQFAHVIHQFNQQSAIIGELQAMLEADNEISFASIRKSCFACDDLSTIRRLLLSKMQLLNANGLMNKISSTWDNSISQVSSIAWLDSRLVTINPAVVTNKLQKVVIALISARNGEHIPYLQTLLSDLAWLDHVSDADRQELNEMLRPYYNYIFLLDNKWKALKVFGKKHNLSWDEKLEQKLVEKDRNYLQHLFDTRRSKLRSVLQTLGIHTVDDIMATMASMPPCTLAALEYIQLELSEMLTAVEHFGDNFYYLQHRIPMIHGKNYRNQLAHDALSYNLLTDSGDLKLLINAIILADMNVNLFDKDIPNPPALNEISPTTNTHQHAPVG